MGRSFKKQKLGDQELQLENIEVFLFPFFWQVFWGMIQGDPGPMYYYQAKYGQFSEFPWD